MKSALFLCFCGSVIPDLELPKPDKHEHIYVLNYSDSSVLFAASPWKHRQFALSTYLFHKLTVLIILIVGTGRFYNP